MDVHSNVGGNYEMMGDYDTQEFSWALSLLCPIVIILGSASA